MFRGFIKWLSYYWVLPYPYVLLSVFLSAFVCNAVFADAHYVYKIITDCSVANDSLNIQKQQFRDYLESFNCINIKVSANNCFKDLEGSPDSDCTGLYSSITGFANPDIPGSCMTPYPFEPWNNRAGFSARVISSMCEYQRAEISLPAGAVCASSEFQIDPWEETAPFHTRPRVTLGCTCGEGFSNALVPGRYECRPSPYQPVDDQCNYWNGALRQQCRDKCGDTFSTPDAEKNIAYEHCVSDNYTGEVQEPHHCFCKEDLPEGCDIVTGVGCSTYDKQDKSINAMKRIENAILNRSLNYTGVEGILLKSDGSYVDIKTLLTQISNANGITSAPAPSGIGQEQTKEAIKEAADNAFNVSLTRVDKADFSTELEQIQDDILDKKTEIGALLDEVKTTLFSSFSISASNVSKHLPCWRNINISGSNYFDICLADYEESLNYIPAFFIGFSFLMAAFIIIRPTNNEDDLWHD